MINYNNVYIKSHLYDYMITDNIHILDWDFINKLLQQTNYCIMNEIKTFLDIWLRQTKINYLLYYRYPMYKLKISDKINMNLDDIIQYKQMINLSYV